MVVFSRDRGSSIGVRFQLAPPVPSVASGLPTSSRENYRLKPNWSAQRFESRDVCVSASTAGKGKIAISIARRPSRPVDPVQAMLDRARCEEHRRGQGWARAQVARGSTRALSRPQQTARPLRHRQPPHRRAWQLVRGRTRTSLSPLPLLRPSLEQSKVLLAVTHEVETQLKKRRG